MAPSVSLSLSRSEHFRDSEKEKPSILEYVFTFIQAAKKMKKSSPDKSLKVLLEEACEMYNESMKKKRAYIITGPSRSFMNALAKCPKEAIDLLQMHYLKYKHKDSGTGVPNIVV